VRRPARAVITAAVLMATACGARVGPYVGTGIRPGTATVAGPTAAIAPGGAVPTGAQAPQAGSSTGPMSAAKADAASGGGAAPGGSTGPSGAALSPQAAAELTPATFPYAAGAEAALCTGTAGNGSSDVGVTPTTVTIGNVSGLTGILSNNFEQGPEAVQALFSAINAAGGICGRRLQLEVEDDGQDSGKNAADTSDLASRVFAFVGSTSDADNGGAPVLASTHVPDVGTAINVARGQTGVFWTTTGGATVRNGQHYIYDTLVRGLKAAGNFPQRFAVLSYSIPISADAAQQFLTVFTHEGATSCFTDESVSPATASLDQDVLQMKSKGCDGVYTTMDVTGNAKLLQAMQRQQFHPRFAGTTFDGYTPAQISVAGQSAAQGFEVNLPFLPFTDGNAVVSTYESDLRTYEPGKEPSSFGLEAWADAQMFIYGLIKAGHNPTRPALVQAFGSIDSWNTGGATAPYVPRLREPPGPCSVEAVVQGAQYVRKWPASGYFCDGQLVPAGP